jgi:hypothetical protein
MISRASQRKGGHPYCAGRHRRVQQWRDEPERIDVGARPEDLRSKRGATDQG